MKNELFEKAWGVYLEYMQEVLKVDESAEGADRLDKANDAWMEMIAEISKSGLADDWNAYCIAKQKELGTFD